MSRSWPWYASTVLIVIDAPSLLMSATIGSNARLSVADCCLYGVIAPTWQQANALERLFDAGEFGSPAFLCWISEGETSFKWQKLRHP